MSIKHIVHMLVAAVVLAAAAAQAQPPDGVNPPGLERAIEVQEKYTGALMAREGVEGTGVGYNDEGEVAVKVYTSRTGIPGIPLALEQVPVEVVVTGKFVARAATDRFSRPVPIGVSTGHPDITAGTIGARVRDASGKVYVLSNNHVYANNNEAALGDNALQPGAYDGGQDPADAIGTLHDYEPLLFDGRNNTIDAAVASTSTGVVSYATPGGDGYGSPSSTTVAPALEQKVQKYGRTSGWTKGAVAELNVTVDVCYEVRYRGPFVDCLKVAHFVDQIGIAKGGSTDPFSSGGDSGSLIVTDDGNNNPVGLLFAGSDTRTLANPIDKVLARFGVTIDDGSSGNGGSTNSAPTADFTFTKSALTADFTDASTDSDGTVGSWSWAFGDGATSTTQNPSHTYAASGTYSVRLTVTDDDGATGSTSQDVTVTSPTSGGISLSARGYKDKGLQKADLTWSGATSTDIDLYRSGDLVTTTANDGAYTDNINERGGGSYTYQVCEAATSTCSADAVVDF